MIMGGGRMKFKKVLSFVLPLILTFLLSVVGSKIYYNSNYVMIERQKAENVREEEGRDMIEINKKEFGQFSTLFEAYKEISEDHLDKVSGGKLIDGAVKGMIESTGDIYSSYTPVSNKDESAMSKLNTTYYGIGAEITILDGKPVITNPYKEAPAFKAGVMPYDRILKVNGEEVEGKDIEDIVSKIKGEKGSKVRLTISRGENEPFDVEIVRDEIHIHTVMSEIIKNNGKTIGNIEISSFSDTTANEFEDELKKIESQKIDGLILDVRGNTGGYLESVNDIASLLLPKNDVILMREDKNGKRTQVRSHNPSKVKKEYPIVVLVDGLSASASEILAGSLQQSGGYDLIGEKTYGKGTVQELKLLSDGSELRMTIGKWLTPKAFWVHEKGIKPNIEVKNPDVFFIPSIQTEKEPVGMGRVSNDILYTQELLKLLGYDIVQTEGYFGERTEKALKEFQSSENLEQTGVLDKDTVFRLNKKVTEIRNTRKYDLQFKKAVELIGEK